MKYDRNKNVILLLSPIPIKYLPKGTEFLHSLIATSIKEGGCSDACKFVAHHCANGSSQIKVIYVDKYYSPVANAGSSRINIDITAMHILTASILDLSNAFQNKNDPIYEIICVIPPPYYLYWFEISYTNNSLNQYDGTFYLQCMNGM